MTTTTTQSVIREQVGHSHPPTLIERKGSVWHALSRGTPSTTGAGSSMGSAQTKARRRTQAALSASRNSNSSASSTSRSGSSAQRRNTTQPSATGRTQTYAVTVPAGVGPGGRFAVILGGQRHEFTCPPGARAGSTVHVEGQRRLAAL